MKMQVPGLAFLGMMVASCSNQKISSSKVPSVVLNTVQKKYPAAREIDWEKNDSIYIAEIDLNDRVTVTVQIHQAGKLVMQKLDIAASEIPAPVLTTVHAQYGDYRIDDRERLEIGDAVYYQLELEAKGKKDLDLVFTADGRVEKTIRFWD
jgi:hypothetical protein